MKFVVRIPRRIAAQVRGKVKAPARRAWVAFGALAITAGLAGGPAYALGLFGEKVPERVTNAAGVKELAESKPDEAFYNAALNGWDDWKVAIVLALVIGLGFMLAKKASNRHEGHGGGPGAIVLAIAAVLLAGGIAA